MKVVRHTSGASKVDEATVLAVVAWMRGIPLNWREDWGLNATEEIADLLESGLWMLDGAGPNEGTTNG